MRKKILIVDDDPEMVELLRFNFKQAGYSIGTASNGAEALKKARSIAPDLIVLDLMMPELDGFSVCEILRRDKSTASIPIIMLTALASQFAHLTSLESGATDYMTKPFSPKAVISRAQHLLESPAAAADSFPA
ncbi:MAG: response regulator [Akkermansiaceae bacterium]|nr:response regulator [Verrucomicrobiales bacterium]